MTTVDPYLSEVFPKPPVTAYRRQRNLKDFLVRAKVYPEKPRFEKRVILGMKKCNKPCPICPYILEGKSIKGLDFNWQIRQSVNCKTKNIIYMIECSVEKCKQRYIGESERNLKERMSEHIGYVKNNIITQATGEHFNLPGHDHTNMQFKIIEKVKKSNLWYRKEREHYHIKKFNTYYKGINRTP